MKHAFGRKTVLVSLFLTLAITLSWAGVVFDETYAIADITLVDANLNHPDLMKGFSIQGLLTEAQKKTGDILSVAMAFTTGAYDTVAEFFTSGDFAEEALFLALVDQLDIEGRIRNLSGNRLDYLDGNTDDPIRFYGDGVDLLYETTPHHTAGEYRFYLIVVGETKALWIGEADKTFTVTQEEIDTSKAFNAGFELIQNAHLLECAEASSLSVAEKELAAVEHYKALIDSLNLGLQLSVKKDDHPDYPDDFIVTLTKGTKSASKYVTLIFGH